VSDVVRGSRCERARAWAALEPDGELGVLERRLLDAHLVNCAACHCFATLVADIAAELRAAAAERPSRRVVLPAAPVRRSVYLRLRNAGSLAAVAAMALAIAAQSPLPADHKRRAGPSEAAPAGVDDAKQRTLRLLRREAVLAAPGYPDRPARAFGNQPA
jgi:predicted anti-sigma-YlaC factor YlaD